MNDFTLIEVEPGRYVGVSPGSTPEQGVIVRQDDTVADPLDVDDSSSFRWNE